MNHPSGQGHLLFFTGHSCWFSSVYSYTVCSLGISTTFILGFSVHTLHLLLFITTADHFLFLKHSNFPPYSRPLRFWSRYSFSLRQVTNIYTSVCVRILLRFTRPLILQSHCLRIFILEMVSVSFFMSAIGNYKFSSVNDNCAGSFRFPITIISKC